jgi:hypothetical protein
MVSRLTSQPMLVSLVLASAPFRVRAPLRQLRAGCALSCESVPFAQQTGQS